MLRCLKARYLGSRSKSGTDLNLPKAAAAHHLAEYALGREEVSAQSVTGRPEEGQRQRATRNRKQAFAGPIP